MDERFLREALDLARSRRGFTYPNPAVGSVVVRSGRALARGSHFGSGHPHAEVEALRRVADPKGSTVYVSLEPCCHWGRTPPCTDLLIQSGVKEVVYAFADPNPKVAGKGHQQLVEAGITVRQVRLQEIDAFYESYAHWVKTGTPLITAKLAMSLDGRIAGPNGTPVAITGPELQGFTHAGRKLADAILTSMKTVLRDNPMLNVRIRDQQFRKPLYLIDSRAELPLSAKVFETAEKLTVFHEITAPKERLLALEAQGVTTVAIEADANSHLSLTSIMKRIGEDGIHDLWVECGGELFSNLATEKWLRRAYLYVGPRWLGNEGIPAFREGIDRVLEGMKEMHWTGVGRDALCEVEW